MNSDPVEVALREITDTKQMLEALITSSESFDYVRAKATLDELRLKIKVLARRQAELGVGRTADLSQIIPFPASCGPRATG